jgi:hypothetical protein
MVLEVPMTSILEERRHATTGHGGVVARLSYVLPDGTTPVSYAYPPPDGHPWESARFEDVPMHIADARRAAGLPSLHECGFGLFDAPSAVRDFEDPAELRARYEPELVELALAATQGRAAWVFDHLVRKRDPAQPTLSFGRTVRGSAPTANGRVHNDYTETSGQRRLRLVLADEALAGAVARYCIVNVWRPLAHPVLDAPLAVCDARSVTPGDAVVGEVRYPRRRGEIYLYRHAARHRWYYYPGMRPHETLVFKQYDSAEGVARYTPHAAFELPDIPPGTPPRQSIEARILVVMEWRQP